MTTTELTVLAMLAVFGLLYDQIVEYVQQQLPEHHGVTAWLVVVGVTVTLGGVLILTDLRTFLLVLLCFIFAGTPMIIGSMGRYLQARRSVH